MCPRSLPDNFIQKIIFPKNLIHYQFNIMAHFLVQVQINAPIFCQDFPHEYKAFAKVLQEFRRFDLVAVARGQP